ncbi:hypothetical protein [Clostridium baratii]|nr:hypothetical protein [Clostridium baratii]MDY3206702.1 hypothetical protein [Clostridium baratii]
MKVSQKDGNFMQYASYILIIKQLQRPKLYLGATSNFRMFGSL